MGDSNVDQVTCGNDWRRIIDQEFDSDAIRDEMIGDVVV